MHYIDIVKVFKVFVVALESHVPTNMHYPLIRQARRPLTDIPARRESRSTTKIPTKSQNIFNTKADKSVHDALNLYLTFCDSNLLNFFPKNSYKVLLIMS
jgi:hypothetical protein